MQLWTQSLLAGKTSITDWSLSISSMFKTEKEATNRVSVTFSGQSIFRSQPQQKYDLETVDSSHPTTVHSSFSLDIPWRVSQQSADFNEMIILLKCFFECTKWMFCTPFSEHIRILKYSRHSKIWITNTI